MAGLLCSSDNRGGMERQDEEVRKQPSGDPSSGKIPLISFHPGYLTSTVLTGVVQDEEHGKGHRLCEGGRCVVRLPRTPQHNQE